MVPTRMTHGHADQYTGVGVAIGATMDGRHTTARSNTRRVRHPPLASGRGRCGASRRGHARQRPDVHGAFEPRSACRASTPVVGQSGCEPMALVTSMRTGAAAARKQSAVEPARV